MSKIQDKLIGEMLKSSKRISNINEKSLGIQYNQLSALESINESIKQFNEGVEGGVESGGKTSDIIKSAFSGMGSGIKDMLNSLILLPKVKESSLIMFSDFLDSLMKTFERSSLIDYNQLNNFFGVMDKVEQISNNALIFSIKMGLLSKTLPQAEIGMSKLSNMFVRFESSFGNLNFDRSMLVINSLEVLSSGISRFSRSIALSTPLAIIGYPGYLLTSVMILGYNKLFNIIQPKSFRRGGQALQSLAIGLIGITGGLALFQLAGITMETVGKSLLVVGGLSLIMVLISNIGKSVLVGALGLMALGGSMILLSMGLSAFQDLNLEFGDVGIILATLGGLAVVTGLAGVFAMPILLGSGALSVIGLSLASISGGLKSFSELDWDDGITDNLVNAITGISKAFSVLGFVETAVLATKITLLGSASGTLISLSSGLSAFKRADFNSTDADKMSYIIGSVSAAFAVAGSTDGTSNSVLSFFTGIDMSPNNVERGIHSVSGAGNALRSITDGLVAWRGVYDAGFVSEDFQMGSDGLPVSGTLLHNIYSVLTAFKAVFAEIGQSANTGTSLIKNIFGADFSESDVEQGIESVSGAGNIIKNIAQGLVEFKSLEKMGFSSEDFALGEDGLPIKGSLLHNVYSVLTVIKSIFAEIGKSANGESSWVKSIFGADFSESDVEQGIESVSGAGDVVVDISQALKNLSTIENIEEVTNNMINLITAFPVAAIEAYKVIKNSGIGFEELENFFENPYSKIVEVFSSVADTMLKLDKTDGTGFDKLGMGMSSIFTQVERISTVKGRMYSVMLFEKFVNSVEKLTKHKRDIKDLSNEFMSMGQNMGQVLDPIDAIYTNESNPIGLNTSITKLPNSPISGFMDKSNNNKDNKDNKQVGTNKKTSDQTTEMMQQMMLMMQQQMNMMSQQLKFLNKSNNLIVQKLSGTLKTKDEY